MDDAEIAVRELEGDGSFDSPECLRLLDEADIVVTNPPFSRFLDFLPLLINRGKKFLILGNNFHAKAKEIFPYFMSNQLWLGYYYGNMNFMVPDHYRLEGNRAWVDERGQKWHSLGNIVWYTNLEVKKRHEPLTLFKTYDPAVNFTYDNYDAIDCNRYTDIPMDYFGEIGVPITYLCHHNPDYFELVGTSTNDMPKGAPYHNGKRMFERLLIRRKQ